MRGFASLLRRFRDDERGVFAVLFGVMAIVLIATAGAVVDFTHIELTRTKAQQALDSAALGLQPKMFLSSPPTSETLKSDAKALLDERLADGAITTTVDVATTNTTDGTLHLEGTIRVPTAFVALIGIPDITARIVSEATRKRLNLEIAMVLDNSNSMKDSSRMTNLIAATKCAANILFNGDCSSTETTASNSNVYIGLVPFTLAVNVGTNNSSASWIDRTGSNAGNPTLDNFDTDDDDSTRTITSLDRLGLFDQLTNVSWGGCVEARIHDTVNNRLYDTDDTLPSTATPYSLFTPYFAPDEPDSGGYNNNYLSDRPSSCTNKDQGSWEQTITKTGCTSTASSRSRFDDLVCLNTSTSTKQTDGNGKSVNPASSEPSSINGQEKVCNDDFDDQRTSRNPNRYTNTYTRSCSYNFSDRELQERYCKYSKAKVNSINQGQVKGPNGDCPTNAIQPLTATKSLVTKAINALTPQGGTNIHAGVEWGFRVLSPSLPFSEGRSYSNATSKVMIVMTDGENTAYPNGNMNNSTFYGYYGYPYNKRLGDVTWNTSQLQKEMNARTVATCNNAKAQGIVVYTIGLEVGSTSDPTGNTKMLKDCSSGDGFWYFPTKSSDLITVFQNIANQLSNLRLSK